jgi:hypothetical protein
MTTTQTHKSVRIGQIVFESLITATSLFYCIAAWDAVWSVPAKVVQSHVTSAPL